MTTYDAVMIAEGIQEPESEAQYIEAWQELVNSGMAWTLQGSFGRQAMRMIDDGLLTRN